VYAHVTVIVVAYHSDSWVARCLFSLLEHTTRPLSFLVVDNGGNTSLGSLKRRAKGNMEVVVTGRPLGFAEANNFALVNGGLRGDYVCFLNQDTISRIPWLDACIECMESRPNVGAVIPLITDYEGTAWDEAFLTCAKADRELTSRLQQGVLVDLSDLPEFVPVPEITAAAMVVRKEALLKAGPFDPIYGSYYEDYDLCRRIARAGYDVGICTRGRVGHYGGSVTTDRAAYCRRARWITRNRVIYAARWKWSNRPLGLLWYLALEMPRNLARSVLGRSNVPLVSFLKAHWDLAQLFPRLISERFDGHLWERYLRSLPWPAVDEILKPCVEQINSR
jgi:N-acetylglucosaminyl-diphospho-decaprenol L-rhamnosyltransferase